MEAARAGDVLPQNGIPIPLDPDAGDWWEDASRAEEQFGAQARRFIARSNALMRINAQDD